MLEPEVADITRRRAAVEMVDRQRSFHEEARSLASRLPARGLMGGGHELSVLLLVLALLTSSCTPRPRFLSGDPEATFVGHEANGILFIDRMPGGQPIAVRPKGFWRRGTVIYVPSEGGAGDWTLSLGGPGEVAVAHANDAASYESVAPSWDNNAIRLTLERRDGPPLRTDVLARAAGPGATSFSRLAQLSVDVPGSYEGAVRDQAGRQVGWLRLRISANDAHVVCEGVLPQDIDEALIAATLLAFASEVDWVENHVRGVSRPPTRRP